MTEPVPAPQPLPFTTERRDASITEQWDVPSRTYRRYESGTLTVERPFTDAEIKTVTDAAVDDARRLTRADLLARVRAARTSNAAYLDAVAAGTATNAQHVAQTAALTRQMQGVIRLLVGADLLDAVDG